MSFCKIPSKKRKLQSQMTCWKAKSKHSMCCYERSYVPSINNQDGTSHKIMQTAGLKNNKQNKTRTKIFVSKLIQMEEKIQKTQRMQKWNLQVSRNSLVRCILPFKLNYHPKFEEPLYLMHPGFKEHMRPPIAGNIYLKLLFLFFFF